MSSVAARTTRFTESVIREMTRLAEQHGAINLAQGFPDFPAPAEVKEAARRAIADDINQYAITWGAKPFRDAIAAKLSRFYGWDADPEREITVTCGATEGMIASMMALIDPADEVIVFEPFYENYGADAILSGAEPRYVTLHEPDWHIDPDELTRAFNERTKAIVINSPHNPTGKVFRRDELELIASLCQRWDVLALTDEIYEHIVYGAGHVPTATIPGMRERTVTINALSKTYAVTGWRVGWVVAPPHLTDAVRKVHDFLTVGAPAPLQEAGAFALTLPDAYYAGLARDYGERRDALVDVLQASGFGCRAPDGAYYVMADIGGLTPLDDVAFANWLVETVRVAAVPGSSFYASPGGGRGKVRFAFAKRLSTLEAAAERLAALAGAVPA